MNSEKNTIAVVYRYFRQRSRNGRYRFSAKCTMLSAIIFCRFIHFESGAELFTLRKCAGRIRKASISENNNAKEITTESWRVNCAVTPDRNSQGANATMVVSTAKITGRLTAKAPAIAASSPFSPRWWTW